MTDDTQPTVTTPAAQPAAVTPVQALNYLYDATKLLNLPAKQHEELFMAYQIVGKDLGSLASPTPKSKPNKGTKSNDNSAKS